MWKMLDAIHALYSRLLNWWQRPNWKPPHGHHWVVQMLAEGNVWKLEKD